MWITLILEVVSPNCILVHVMPVIIITLNFEPSTSLAFRSSCSDMAAAKAMKRAHKILAIEEKVEILNQIGKKSYKLLSEQYGVGISTISDTQYTLPANNLNVCHMHAVITILAILQQTYSCIMVINTCTWSIPPDLQKTSKFTI